MADSELLAAIADLKSEVGKARNGMGTMVLKGIMGLLSAAIGFLAITVIGNTNQLSRRGPLIQQAFENAEEARSGLPEIQGQINVIRSEYSSVISRVDRNSEKLDRILDRLQRSR